MLKRLALSVIFAVVSTAGLQADTLKETFERTYDLPAGSAFSLSNVNGRVRVTSWDQPRVKVHAEKSVRTRNAGDAKEAMAALRDRLESRLKSTTSDVVIFGETAPRLPNTTLFAVPGIKAETAIIAFDLNGIAVSSGSACSSGKVTASHVLAAMGVSPSLLRGAVRVSLGWTTTEAEIERFFGGREPAGSEGHCDGKQDDRRDSTHC